MHSSIELRKVVERLCLTTGRTHTFVDMPGKGTTRDVSGNITYVYGTPGMFTTEFVEGTLNDWHVHYLFTLTEKEFDHEQYQRES